MMKIYQGRDNYLEQLNEPPEDTLTSNLRCIGYSVGFTIWGFLITFVLFVLFVYIPTGVIYLLYRLNLLIDYITNMICLLIITCLIQYIQLLFTRKFLLQDKVRHDDNYRPLNVNNRKVYEISHYFFLFINVAVGLMSCAKRVLLSAVFGALSISRLDRSTLSRDHEKYDSGYITFISMLVVDNAHNNPTMRVFAHLLWTKVLTERHSTSGLKLYTHDQSKLRRKRAINRWFLAYTFIHNPQLGYIIQIGLHHADWAASYRLGHIIQIGLHDTDWAASCRLGYIMQIGLHHAAWTTSCRLGCIIQIGPHHTDWAASYRLGYIIQLGLHHADWAASYRLDYIMQIGLHDTDWATSYRLGCIIQIGPHHTDWAASYRLLLHCLALVTLIHTNKN
ncbi:Stimulated by retinoic acid protein 6 protein-like [Bulinus truncatus]|nr:Stimulated by retinoic acid protein 6 protein-like [Bulinus truncatus]